MSKSSEKKFASPGRVSAIYSRHVRAYPLLLVSTFIGAMGIQVAALAAPWYLRQFFNTLAAAHPTATVVSGLLGIVGILAFIYIAEWALRRVQDLAIMYL